MKYVIISAYILLFGLYGYSAHMAISHPEKILWGFICTFVFGFISIFSVYLYAKNSGKKTNNSE